MPSPVADPLKDARAAALNELRLALKPQPNPVPEQALSLLASVAASDTGQSQATRNFLFWLAGEKDPTGFAGQGGLELRRLDREIKEAAHAVLKWWGGVTRSDEPLYRVLSRLRDQFEVTRGGSV